MLYFIEDATTASEELLQQHGLTDLLPRRKSRQFLSGGPGGKSGLLLIDESFGEAPRYAAGQQTWVPRFGRPGTFVGVWNDRPPTPDQLQQDKITAGLPVKLLDGHDWVVPLLREWREQDEQIVFEIKLPTVLGRCQQTGAFVRGDVVRTYRDLWNRSCAIADDLLSGGNDGIVTLDSGEFDRFVADTLAVNYRVTADEIGLLGLLNDDLYQEILLSALDWHRLMGLLGNFRSRLEAAGTEAASSSTSIDSGEQQPIAAANTATAQP